MAVRLLALLACLFAPLPVAAGEEREAMRSILLVARKDLPDPYFRDTVVLVTHRGRAPVGVILNRPTDVPLERALPQEGALRSRPERLHFGGPVGGRQLVVVFRSEAPREDAIELLEGIYMTSKREHLAELLAREDPLADVRIFAGHASWAPGQLEKEVARGDWLLLRADAGTVFHRRPDASLWRDLHRRASATPVRFNAPSRPGALRD